MNKFELTPQQAKLCLGALNFRANRKWQQIRNMERRKETIVEQVGEVEYNHRIALREKYAAKLDILANDLKGFIDTNNEQSTQSSCVEK